MQTVRTTVRIADDLYRRAKARAAESGRTVSDVIEDAIRVALTTPRPEERRVPDLPVFGGSGVLPGVDLTSNTALRDRMDDDAGVDALR